MAKEKIMKIVEILGEEQKNLKKTDDSDFHLVLTADTIVHMNLTDQKQIVLGKPVRN